MLNVFLTLLQIFVVECVFDETPGYYRANNIQFFSLHRGIVHIDRFMAVRSMGLRLSHACFTYEHVVSYVGYTYVHVFSYVCYTYDHMATYVGYTHNHLVRLHDVHFPASNSHFRLSLSIPHSLSVPHVTRYIYLRSSIQRSMHHSSLHRSFLLFRKIFVRCVLLGALMMDTTVLAESFLQYV